MINIHYQHINSNKKFTLLIHNNKYYFSNRKLSQKCLQFKHLVKDKNNKHFILSFYLYAEYCMGPKQGW